jgi:hypothetical protein
MPNTITRFEDGIVIVDREPGFIADPASIAEAWELIAQTCRQNNCKRVLILGSVDVAPLDMADVFEAGIGASSIADGTRLAFSLSDFRPDEATHFFQTVALNRGTVAKFFDDESEAREWLMEDGDADRI